MDDVLPEWYREIMKGLKPKKSLSPEKKVIIDYLKKCIQGLEDN